MPGTHDGPMMDPWWTMGHELRQDGLAPKAFFLGPREMEEAGAEGYRLQEQLDVGNKRHGCGKNFTKRLQLCCCLGITCWHSFLMLATCWLIELS